MLEKLPEYRKQLEDIDQRLSTPEVLSDMAKYKALMQERSHLAPIIEKMEEKHRVKVKTECYNQRDELVIVGEGQEYIM